MEYREEILNGFYVIAEELTKLLPNVENLLLLFIPHKAFIFWLNCVTDTTFYFGLF